MCEDSIALKEKHRGKNSFCNILFQNPRFSNEKQQWKPQKLPSKESRERTSFYLKHNESTLKNLKLKPKTSSEIGNNIMKMSEGKFPEVRKIEDRQNNFINSPLYSRFNNSSYCRNRKQDGKLSLPKVMSPTTIVDENLKTKESTLVSPIGVLPFAGAVSMSKVKGFNFTFFSFLYAQYYFTGTCTQRCPFNATLGSRQDRQTKKQSGSGKFRR